VKLATMFDSCAGVNRLEGEVGHHVSLVCWGKPSEG